MLKLIALNYTVMLNGNSQWLNIKGGGAQKEMPLKSLCCLYINLKID